LSKNIPSSGLVPKKVPKDATSKYKKTSTLILCFVQVISKILGSQDFEPIAFSNVPHAATNSGFHKK
jgi:hypothetical protein